LLGIDMARIYTDGQIEESVQKYISGIPAEVIARQIGASGSAVIKWLEKRNIPKRSKSVTFRKYHCNHNYFNEPMDEEHAYWIGFLMADGYICLRKKPSGPYVSLTAALRDKKHLEKFLFSLNSNHPILDMTYKGTCRIEICSGELVTALAGFNVINNKGKTEVPTPSIPKEYRRHFYRGLVDGDGWLYYNRWSGWTVGLCGRRTTMQDYCNWLHEEIGVRGEETVKPHHAIFEARYTGARQVRRIVGMLYSNCTIFLDRKMDLAQKIIHR